MITRKTISRSVGRTLGLTVVCASSVCAAQLEAPFTTATRYNAVGDVTGTIAPDPDQAGPLRLRAVRNTYSQGLLVRIETGQLTNWADESVAPADWGGYGFAALSTREIAYDGYGRTSSERLRGADGTIESLVQHSYDGQGRVECVAVRMNKDVFASISTGACDPGTPGSQGPDRITRFTYDNLDQILTEVRAYRSSLEQTYVTNTYSGRFLTSRTDANGNRTEIVPDSYWRVFRRIYPSPTNAGAVNTNDYNEFTYEDNGNLKTERKRNGALITYAYDGNNRVIEKAFSNQTYTKDVRYDYDLRGLTLGSYFEATPQVGAFNQFDGFGRPLTSTSSVQLSSTSIARTLTYEHDNDGNRRRVTHPDGAYFQYEFDGMNRVSGVRENGSSSLVTVGYKPSGERQNLVRGGGATTVYGYNNAGRLGSLVQNLTGTADDVNDTFLYNPAGQITQYTQGNSAYAYPGNFNRTGNYRPNGLNQYSILDGQQVAYDVNGNLTSDGVTGYTYDLENRLVSTTGPVSDL
jgi:YD repeat-containing protein